MTILLPMKHDCCGSGRGTRSGRRGRRLHVPKYIGAYLRFSILVGKIIDTSLDVYGARVSPAEHIE